jgi:hypothetical protein
LDIAAIIHSKLPCDSYISFDEICPSEIKVKAGFVSSAGNNVTLSDVGDLSFNIFQMFQQLQFNFIEIVMPALLSKFRKTGV